MESLLDTFCLPVSNFWWDGPNCPDNRTSCYDEVDLSLCFEDSAIFYGIVALFLFLAVFWFISAIPVVCGSQTRPSIPIGLLHVAKLLLLLVPLATALCDFGYTIYQGAGSAAPYQYLSPLVLTVTMVVCLLMMTRDRIVGQRSSGLLFLFWLGLVIYGTIKLRTLSLLSIDNNGVQDVFRFVTFVLQYMTYIAQFVLSLFKEPTSKKYSTIDVTQQQRKPCPEMEATFLSRITWWWQNAQIWYGWRHPLTYDDLADLNEKDKSGVVAPQFQKHWDNEIKRAGINLSDKEQGTSNRHQLEQSFDESYRPSGRLFSSDVEHETRQKKSAPSLVRALFKTFWRIFLISGLFKLSQDLLAFVSPQLLRLIIGFTNDPNVPYWHGYLFAILLFLTAVVQSLLLHQYFHRVFRMGMRIRTSIIAAVYDKSLRLSNKARRTSTVGEIVNLMSVDAQRFMDLMTFIHLIWSAPLQILLSLIFLYLSMGPSIFAGVAVMILTIPVNALIASYSKKLQAKQMVFKDSRIKIVNEVLNGIKVIKLYAWELPFQKMIFGIRDKELDVLKKATYLNAAGSFTWMCAPFMVALATFATFSLANLNNPDEGLTAERAFVALSLFNILRFPLSMLPRLISMLVQVVVSVKRLRTFLENDELDPNTITWREDPAIGKESSVAMSDGTFSWDDEGSKATLSGVDFDVKAGELVAVVGHVGAGKSSLIQALLGEMDKTQGQVSVKGQVAYVSQQAWIQNATVKDNILFGKQTKDILYSDCLSGCALEPDLEILPGGDMTEIGEKGINLSGGQKQRVSLARAVYQEADVYLLDDPLSAVDSHVGKHIFDKVIGPDGMLRGKARILVTHGVGFLSQCDKIVVMVEGKVTETGTYTELIENNGAFAEFLRNFSNMDNEEGEEGPDDAVIVQAQRQQSQESNSGVELQVIKSDRVFTGFQRSHSHTDEKETALNDTEGAVEFNPTPEVLRAKLEKQGSQESLESNASSQASLLKRSQESLQVLSYHSSQSSLDKHPSKKSLDGKKSGTTIIDEEKAKTGTVSISVIKSYIKACTWIMSVLVFLFYGLSNALSVSSNFWLAEWSNAEGNFNKTNFTAITFCDHPDHLDVGCYLGIYAGLGFSQAFMVLFSSLTLASAGVMASRTLHTGMLKNILRSPMSFFDTTPTGRILNRFSKDIYTIDEIIPRSLQAFFFTFFSVISTIMVIVISTPIFGVVIIPLGIFYLLVQRFYVTTSRQLKRLESITRSPIYSHFQETVTGASTIRAYRKQERFMLESQSRVDYNQIAYYPSICANRWLAIRLEFVGNLIILSTALFAVLQRNFPDQLPGISAGLVGLSISYSLQLTQTLNWVVRMTSELETNIVAVERTKEYAETPTEAPPIVESHRPPPVWPSQGHVKFDQYSTRYREGLDLVLRKISAEIPGGTKVGIVGRTGAGKSSLTLALFRIIESAGGSIFIDNINISVFGLDDLRSRITIIPQDPVLFSGTLRVNLDPFDTNTDQEVWSALESAHLSTFVSSLEKGLQHEVAEGGENLSVGQRQLVCLARALLRKTKILVLDEATAAVDLETDDLIQKTIRTEFADSTVITIAHRLNTIMDYDMVMVLDSGRIAEYDSPTGLLSDHKSAFYSMAKDAGLV
ncbi:multidrug resistance-associated protein 1-like [Halichondria panicea]|uniref:multidrug resistance-associated protein 1-like n=1 Tax=Halichondria panicea TaxID=6063 RepID=UPI00312B6065